MDTIACGFQHTLKVCKERFYSLGRNHDSVQYEVSVSCGGYHTLIHCKDGLYSFGFNGCGQLGIGNNKHQSILKKTKFNPNEVVSVSCGSAHTFVHCKDGLYSFGWNGNDQLGIGNRENQSTPQKTKFNPNKVVSVSCGGSYTFIHCNDGLYSFGNNEHGQLGIGNRENQSTPQKTTFNPNEVVSVSCGGAHTFIHCKDGLYSFGKNEHGQLGIGNRENQSTPQKTTFNPNEVISIFCGGSHTFIHCNDGLYSFGNNEYGQLGIGNNEHQPTPQKTTFNPNEVISISCGGYHTFIHCNDGLYSFGNNVYGQLGVRNQENQSTPQKTTFDPNEVISISCGGYHTFIYCKDGLYSFGRNGYGQLGIKICHFYKIPQKHSFIPHLTIKESEKSESKQKIQKMISNQSVEMSNFVKYLFETKDNSDITIKNHKVHKALILVKYPQLLCAETQNILKSMNDIAFNFMIKWIYTDKLDCEPIIIPEILKYSLEIQIYELKQKCLETISLVINKNQNTAFDILIEAQKYSLKGLSNKLIWFIGSNKLKIPKAFYAQNPPKTLIMKIIDLSSLSMPQIDPFQTIELKENTKKAFSKLLNHKESADSMIVVNDSIVIYLHKFVLASRWKYFNDIIINQEKIHITINLPISTFLKVIMYFYVGLKTISIYDACWILQYAEKYHLTTHKNLIDLCKYTTESIRLNDWKETLTFAINSHHKQLGTNVVQQTLNETTPKELFQYIIDKISIQQQQVNQQDQQINQLHQQINQQDQQNNQRMNQLHQQINQQDQQINYLQQQVAELNTLLQNSLLFSQVKRI